MKVPDSPNGQMPQQEQPSLAALLMAAAHMHETGRLAELSAQGQDPKRGYELRAQRIIRDQRDLRQNIDSTKGKAIEPGERITDPVLGPTSPRDVRGD